MDNFLLKTNKGGILKMYNYIITSDQISNYAELINKFGPITVTLALFIVLFLLLLSILIKGMQSTNKQIMKQQQDLLKKIMDNNSKPIKKEKNIVEIFVKIDDSIKEILKKTNETINADRISVYVFHNGVYSSHGLPFFKTSCVSEIVEKNCGIPKKADVHINMPLSIFDSSIKTLYKDGRIVIENVKDIKSKYAVLYNMLTEVQVKSATGVAVYDKDNNILAVIIAEFIEEKSTEEIELATNKLIEETSCLAPILEYSDYQNMN